MEKLLEHLLADVDRWEEQDHVSAHAAADLRYYARMLLKAHEHSVDHAEVMGRMGATRHR